MTISRKRGRPRKVTKMIWEMQPGDIGKCRDKNKTLVYCCQDIDTLSLVYINFVTKRYDVAMEPEDGEPEIAAKMRKMFGTDCCIVDLLPFTLT